MDYSEMIQAWIKEDKSLIITLMGIASQLYRENGIDQIEYEDMTFNKGDILFTDEQWDKLKQQTKFIEPRMNASRRPKVKQMYAFGTLEKFTEKTLQKYINRIDKIDGIEDLILLPKYDGVGMRVYYGDMFLTRYDKQYGLDISYKVKHLYPNIPKNCVLRGELITLVDHEGYATKRHYVSAMVGNELPLPNDIKFVCYEYLEDDKKLSFKDMLKKIYKIFKYSHPAVKVNKNSLTAQLLQKFYEEKIPKEYKTDGVVIRPDSPDYSFENKEKPSYQVAYKFDSERFKGKVKEIQWSIKQQGFLQPTIILTEPIKIDNSVIQKATGNNYNYLRDQKLYPGADCYISLKIVPRIEGCEKNQKKEIIPPEVCPNCGGRIEIVEDSVDRFKCADFYKNKCFLSIIINRAKKFLEVKGIGEKGLQKLIQSPEFDFMKWVKQYNPTDKQMFLILSDNADIKKIDQIYSETRLDELKTLYGFK